MQSIQSIPALRDVVLVGGGHSHVQVIKSFGMHPEPGVRLTVICRDLQTPYSGMLPGCLSGVYTEAEIHIQLGPLCRFAGARLIHADVTGLDVANNAVHFADRPPLRYDLLSLNTGAVPKPPHADAITVKPISQFLPKWQKLVAEVMPGQKVIIVGAGAGGVELAFAARAVLPPAVTLSLVGEKLLPGHPQGAVDKVTAELNRRNISWVAKRAVSEVLSALQLADGEAVAADYVLWVTDVTAPAWLGDSGLDTDERGFVCVDPYLRSTSHEDVFAAGDVAHLSAQQRPKSGVYAVRAGPFLAENLRRAVRGKSLKRFKAQSRHLALMGTGHGEAVASRGNWSAQGQFWWWLKDRIDRAFMNKFNRLPDMTQTLPDLPKALQQDLPDQLMRCGGCGAKLAADPLRRVLARLPKQDSVRVELGIGDDAAVLKNRATSTVLTIDGFRAMVDDPYLFGRIATHHSLNDVFAMAATPTSALAFVTIPLMAEALMEEELFQLLSGVTDVLNAHNVPLVGGHSAEGLELGVGLTVTGDPGAQTLRKGGMLPGERLIITKALGTGVVLAAAMQGFARAGEVAAVQASMDLSNAAAVAQFVEAGVSAMTDITGFGLAGHLGEMLRASGQGVCLDLAKIPVFDGVHRLFDEVQSSLQQANELALQDYELQGALKFADPRIRVLADPQTSGALLASVPVASAAGCVQALRRLGYTAADVGEVTTPGRWLIR
jgi:selenide, water dikinase